MGYVTQELRSLPDFRVAYAAKSLLPMSRLTNQYLFLAIEATVTFVMCFLRSGS